MSGHGKRNATITARHAHGCKSSLRLWRLEFNRTRFTKMVLLSAYEVKALQPNVSMHAGVTAHHVFAYQMQSPMLLRYMELKSILQCLEGDVNNNAFNRSLPVPKAFTFQKFKPSK